MRLIRFGRFFLLLFVINILLWANAFAQQEPREYQRWGKFGAGKLVTTVNNLNCIADGQLRWPAWAHHPALEYPYNPEPGGRHINYAVGLSFHIGGYSTDYGPSFKPDKVDLPDGAARVESGDRTYYRYYDGFHFEGFPGFVSPGENDGVAFSTDPNTWPVVNGKPAWPDYFPTHDFYHDTRYPDYRNVYQMGMAQPIPLKKDSTTGWPGVGPNGETLADQEFFAENFSRNREYMEDPDVDEGKLMVYTNMRGLSFSGDFYDDFLVYIWVVTNISPEPITKAYMGVLADFDFPWATYLDYSSYSRVDCFAYDKDLQMAYGWDGDGNVPGATYGSWGHPVPAKLTDESIVDNPAFAGVMFLKTPRKDDNSGEVGVGTFDAFYLKSKNTVYGIGSGTYKFYWNNIVNRSPDGDGPDNAYDPDDANKDGIDDWTWDHPYPIGNEAVYDQGYKGEFTLNAGPMTLAPGESDTLIAVVVMGESRDALFKNARFARQLYESGWQPIRPPLEPVVRGEESSGKVRIIWDDRSENIALNEKNKRQSFEGYKLYRSSDGGKTWGSLAITDENGTIADYVPMGQWDLLDGIVGPSDQLPTFQRGNDSGLDEIMEVVPRDTTILEMAGGDTVFFGHFQAGDTTGRRIYVDNDVLDGLTYKYAVVAYSSGDDVAGIPPVQSSKNSGTQIISVTPHASVSRTQTDLENVRVVPNPYRVIAAWEMSQDERKIKFTHLPESCTIYIYNVAGERVQTLEHNQNSPVNSEEVWNLRTYENREVAPGLYFFYMKSGIGEKSGKFVIIK